MTYNVFGGMLNLSSINVVICLLVTVSAQWSKLMIIIVAGFWGILILYYT